MVYSWTRVRFALATSGLGFLEAQGLLGIDLVISGEVWGITEGAHVGKGGHEKVIG
jgi:hypothetical protein